MEVKRLVPSAENGFVTAITGVLTGLIIEVVLKAFTDSTVMGSSAIWLYQVVNLAAIFGFVHATRYWGTLYLIGWWLGSGIMFYSGLFEGLEFAFYSIVLVLILISRVARGFEYGGD